MGYLIAVILQYFLVAYLMIISAIEDIKGVLRIINESTKNKQILQCVSEFIEMHSNVKQLSQIRVGCSQFTSTKFQ